MLKWIIQKNLIKEEILTSFRAAFQELSIAYEEVLVIPFSDELPNFSPAPLNIFYGSTTLMLNAYHSPYRSGVFYNPEKFTSQRYVEKWGKHMLNADGHSLRFEDFVAKKLETQSSWFIRPNSDDKSFAGGTMSKEEIADFYDKIQHIDNPKLNSQSLIFVASPKKIKKEWRNFIVGGKIVASSRYALNGNLNVSTQDISKNMIDFAEARTKEFAPHDIFVMDLAETSNGYKIIECNCFNGTGFYQHDIKEIVKSISEYLQKGMNN
ncbi:MAG: ATP-grasp domain-containing protein [Bacteroidota bacterium]